MSRGQSLGLDAGGTKTVAALADASGRLLRQVTGPGLDPTAGADWQAGLAEVLSRLDAGPVAAAVLGLPFHGEIPDVTAEQSVYAARLIDGPVQVVNDVAVAFTGALGGADGVLILSGTGSMAWARGPAGEVRVGGWGPLIGDEGSAHDLGQAALRLTCQHLDGRAEAAALADAVLAHLGLGPADLIGWASGPQATRERVAGVAQVAGLVAEAGDGATLELMRDAAGYLVQSGRTAARRAGLTGAARWSHAGGLFRSTTLLRLVMEGMGSAPAAPCLTPVGGALLLAARQAGWLPGEDWIAAVSGRRRPMAAGTAREVAR